MVKYARCNALLSLALDEQGQGCRFMAKADTEQAVVDDMSKHMADVHGVDAGELVENIKGALEASRQVIGRRRHEIVHDREGERRAPEEGHRGNCVTRKVGRVFRAPTREVGTVGTLRVFVS